MGQLFDLLAIIDDCDGKLQILSLVSLVVERMGPHIIPLLPRFSSWLPQLWAQVLAHTGALPTPCGSLVYMALRVSSVYSLAGHSCIWPCGSVVYMGLRVTRVHGLAGQ